MGYVSSCTYGCRMKEVLLKGCRVLILENERLHILLLLDKGADIVEFTDKRTDTECLWRSPAGLDLLEQSRTGRECYVGGWFELFPNAGGGCRIDGNDVPFYGDVRHMPWDFAVLQDQPERLSVKLWARSSVLPLSVEKVLTLESGSAMLRIEEKATNLSRQPVEFTWGHHPNIGAPFLDEHCTIELNPCEIYTIETAADGQRSRRAVGRWPYYESALGTTDARKIPDEHQKRNDILYLSDVKGPFVVRNHKTGLAFSLDWDHQVFSSMLLWRGFDGSRWDSLFGYLYILCPLIMSSPLPSLNDAVAGKEALSLNPGDSMQTWLQVSLAGEQTKEVG